MSTSLPRLLAELQRLERSGGRRELQAFSMEGTRLVERALGAEVPLRAVLCAESFGGNGPGRERDLLERLRRGAIETLRAPDPVLERLTKGRSFGAILALAEQPVAAALDDGLFHAPEPCGFHPGVLVVVDAQNPGNVGALVRTALASGARALVSIGSTDPFHPKAVRTSMGSLFRLPLCHFTSSERFLASVNPNWLLCAAVACGGTPPGEVCAHRAAQRPIALCVGSEAHGLPDEFLARLEARLTIPMPAGVDSLSINAAAAVALYALLGKAQP